MNTSPRGPSGDRRGGGRTPRGGGRRGGTGFADGMRERPAHLSAAAPAFTPSIPMESFARLDLAVNGSYTAPASVVSSRAPSGEGRSRSEVGTTRSRNSREKEVKQSEEEQEAPEEEAEAVVETKVSPSAPKSSRRAAFERQTKLTTAGDRAEAAQSAEKSTTSAIPARKVDKDDLISRLTRGLGKRPFVECPIVR